MAVQEEKEKVIVTDESKCQCCWICVMRCGLRFDKFFTPRASKIKVEPNYRIWPEITFKDDCDQCGICVRHCPTGAITFS